MPQQNNTGTAPSSGRIVVLNGFPGTGKLTILKRAKDLLATSRMTCLLDSPLIDAVTALTPGRSGDRHKLRRIFRTPIFERIRKRVLEGATVLLTARLVGDSERSTAFLRQHLDLVRGTDVPIIWVNADCNQAVLEQRLKVHGRYHGVRTKLTDVRLLRDLLREHHLIEPTQSADGSVRLVVKRLDVSGPVDVSVRKLMSIMDI